MNIKLKTFVAVIGLLSLCASAETEEIPVSTIEQLKSAFCTTTDTDKDIVITLAAGTYSFTADTSMSTVACLTATNSGGTARSFVLRGDPAATREQVVIDAGGVRRAVLLDWYRNGSGSHVAIENMTIRNGFASGSKDDGGAVSFSKQSSEYVISNCVFETNAAGEYGGAVFCASGSTLHIFDCLFKGNSANSYGAIRNAMTVSGCRFEDNWASDAHGGALRIDAGQSAALVTNCTFSGNQMRGKSGRAGAVMMMSGTLVDCVFTNNATAAESSSSHHGGAVCVEGPVTVRDCRFSDNVAKAGNGGAIYVKAGETSAQIIGCRFERNKTDGGKNYLGGGIGPFSGLVSNCVFVANESPLGGGVYVCSNVVDCVFAGNKATANDSTSGGGAACDSVLRLCVVTNNVGAYSCGGFLRCRVIDSQISGNRSAASVSSRVQTAKDSVFEGCVFKEAEDKPGFGTYLSNCSASRCSFLGLDARAGGSGSIADSGVLCDYCYYFTNCLFVGNSVKFFFNHCGGAQIVNCSFIENAYYKFAGTVAMNYVNDFFYRNGAGDGTYDDLNGASTGSYVFTNCFLCTASTVNGFDNKRYTKIADVPNPKLAGTLAPDLAYAPRTSSPLAGEGFVEGWMSDALDCSGRPRLTVGKVSIGAFEPVDAGLGLILIFR